MLVTNREDATLYVGKQQERTGHLRCYSSKLIQFVYGPRFGSNPQTGFAEVNGDLREADFWLASLKVCSGHNFRLGRQPGATAQDRPSSEQKNLPPACWGSGFQTDACGDPKRTLCDFEHGSDVTVL